MRARLARRAALTAAASALLVAGCTSGGSGGSTADPPTVGPPTSSASATPPSAPRSSAAALPQPDHVVVAIFENKDVDAVDGSRSAPFFNSLADKGAAFTDAHGETHPSQGNYLALFSGSTQGVEDDSCPQSFSGGNLATQLLAAGKTFAGYSEGMPRAGFTGCESGDYARKHNPWVNFPAVPASVNQPFSALPKDYATLPTVSFVVPDLCNDMHDCSVGTGDSWARSNLGPYLDWATSHNSLLIVTFDEDEGSSENHIATMVAGAGVRAGTSSQRIDHYSLLRTIEDMYGLPPLGKAASAKPLTGIWTEPGAATPTP